VVGLRLNLSDTVGVVADLVGQLAQETLAITCGSCFLYPFRNGIRSRNESRGLLVVHVRVNDEVHGAGIRQWDVGHGDSDGVLHHVAANFGQRLALGVLGAGTTQLGYVKDVHPQKRTVGNTKLLGVRTAPSVGCCGRAVQVVRLHIVLGGDRLGFAGVGIHSNVH